MDAVCLHSSEWSALLFHDILKMLSLSEHEVLVVMAPQNFVGLKDVLYVSWQDTSLISDVLNRSCALIIVLVRFQQNCQNLVRPVTHICSVTKITQRSLRCSLLPLNLR